MVAAEPLPSLAGNKGEPRAVRRTGPRTTRCLIPSVAARQVATQPGEVRGPHLSIVALIDEPAHLGAVIESVVMQSFEDWDLSLVPVKWRPKYARILEGGPADPRVRLVSFHNIVSADGTWLPPGAFSPVDLSCPAVYRQGLTSHGSPRSPNWPRHLSPDTASAHRCGRMSESGAQLTIGSRGYSDKNFRKSSVVRH